MSWKPIVVGVDASPQAADAAAFAARVAERAATSWHLVHAAADGAGAAPAPGTARSPTAPLDALERAQVVAALGQRVPAAALATLTVRPGQPAAVLGDAVAAFGAGLVILGGKHHSIMGRWVGGSTGLDVARSTRVPLFVTVGEPTVRRVLVAVDLSAAARPTIAAAERYAQLFGAELRALSVVEPLQFLPEVPQWDPSAYYQHWEDTLAQDVWPLIRTPGVTTTLRHGAALDGIVLEVASWRPDLLVVGSHGKGWAKRLLVGSVTEGLINVLPTSLLVVPAGGPAVGHQEPGEPA